jgi:hypothetical protein
MVARCCCRWSIEISKKDSITQLINLAVGEGASVNNGLIGFPSYRRGCPNQLFEGKDIRPMFFDHFQDSPTAAGDTGQWILGNNYGQSRLLHE